MIRKFKDYVVNEENDNEVIKNANKLLKEVKDKIIKNVDYDLLYDLTDAIRNVDKITSIKEENIKLFMHSLEIIKRLPYDINFKLINNAENIIDDLIEKNNLENY